MNKPATQTPTHRRGWIIALGVLLGVLIAGGVAFAIDHAVNGDKVPRGVAVGGVEIGRMDRVDAQAKLERDLKDKVTAPIKVRAGELETTVLPAEAGITPNWKATVDSTGKMSYNPITWVMDFFRQREIPISSDADPQLLDAAVQRIAEDLHREPADASINLAEGKAELIPAVTGQSVEPRWVEADLLSEWLNPDGIDLEAKKNPPAIDDSVAQKIINGPAKRALSAPIVLHGQDGVDGVIPPERMGEILHFHAEPDTKKIRPEVDVEAAHGILNEALAETEQERQNARIGYSGGQRVITPHVDGLKINWEESLADFPERVIGDSSKEWDASYVADPASFTTEDAQHATFDEVVGEFSTSGFAAASGHNIKLTAATVNGAIVAPGEIFSLNGYTGPRGTAQGYVESGIILNGHADKAVGGGISQFATTLYNAAYFAGMQDVAHTAHSYYISRYPAGREATVYEGAIDLQFKNTSPYPVRIDTFFGDGSITVKLMGVKTVTVESVNGGRWAPTQPKRITLSGSDCVPSGGAPGFTTSDTRIIRDLAGNEVSRNTTTTVYDPSPIVRCE